MKIFYAAIQNGVVKDVEQSDDTIPISPRLDGLARTVCPDYVQTGFTHNGTEFRMPDGTKIKQSVIDASQDASDLADILDRLDKLKPDVDLMKVATGTNAERIARLEGAFVLLYRVVKRLTRTIQ